ncbi:MAG: hypothetical protein HW384_646, partial [Dehalococcoidia bacterium]|nr:hypothetical protein [Dehalococcoidia bacterium]
NVVPVYCNFQILAEVGKSTAILDLSLA